MPTSYHPEILILSWVWPQALYLVLSAPRDDNLRRYLRTTVIWKRLALWISKFDMYKNH